VEVIIKQEKNNYDFGKLTPEIIKKIRKIFLLPEVIKSPDIISWNLPNKSLIMNLLCENHHLSAERVSKNVDKLSKNYSRCRNYFESHKIIPSSVQTTLDMLI